MGTMGSMGTNRETEKATKTETKEEKPMFIKFNVRQCQVQMECFCRDVRVVVDPFMEDVHDEIVYVVMCRDCEREVAMDSI